MIVAGLLLWVWPSAGKANLALTIAVNGGLVLWTVDEIVRGVNRWRRSLGAVVLLYEFTTLFNDGNDSHAGAGAQMSPRACIVTAPAGLARL